MIITCRIEWLCDWFFISIQWTVQWTIKWTIKMIIVKNRWGNNQLHNRTKKINVKEQMSKNIEKNPLSP